MEGTGNEHLSPIGKAEMKKAGYIIFFVPICSNHEYIDIRPLEIHSSNPGYNGSCEDDHMQIYNRNLQFGLTFCLIAFKFKCGILKLGMFY